MPGTGSRDDPYSAFNFLVEIDNITIAGFSECSGLSSESEEILYRNGDEDIYPRKVTGMLKFGDIMLKRGMTDNDELWAWRKTVMDGQTVRKSGSIVVLNEARQEALRYNFYQGWPSKWEGPSWNAKTSEVAIASLTLKIERMERA
jgi:phage tail-like protein